MGGLARRVSYINAFRHRSDGEVPALFVDAGNLFTNDNFNNVALPSEALIKNQWVIKGYNEFRQDAANISYNDLPYLAELLKQDGYDQRLQEYPVIKKLISANIRPAADSHLAPQPYVIREITLKRGEPNKTLRIGIVGLTQSRPVSSNQKDANYAGYLIDDPFEKARQIIPELKQKVDFIVALAYMPREDLQRLATENPDIDTIIGAGNMIEMNDPTHFNRATITTAYSQTKYLGELRVYAKGDGTIENQLNRYIGLDAIIPDDPSALEMVTKAHDESTNEKNKSATSGVQPTNILGGSSGSAIDSGIKPKN